MDITITPGKLCGTVRAIPSKSMMHRYLICAAFANAPTVLNSGVTCEDIDATIDCLHVLGANIEKKENGYLVTPIAQHPKTAVLNCRESGTTLRFLLPIVGALGIETTFQLDGRLGKRPLSPLWEEMQRMGCALTRTDENTIICTGQLRPGIYSISGNISSQFISGLLFALALMDGASQLQISGPVESTPYLEMTHSVLSLFQADKGALRTPGVITVEGDWSNAAYFFAANKLGCNIQIEGLVEDTLQGDRAIIDYLGRLDINTTIDLSDTPDLFPVLSVVAAAKKGATFTGINRLRYKESDRIQSVYALLANMGINTTFTEDSIFVEPGTLHGGTVDSYGDHRIAMAAAIASIVADGPVTILNADCVRKSYPTFWRELHNLGGIYAQHIR